MSNDKATPNKATPSTAIADKLYPGGKPAATEATKPNNDSEGESTNAGSQDRFAPYFQYLEKNPNDPYNTDVDKRHPELKDLTPEFRPFLREMMMRLELKGFHPRTVQTKRTIEEERRHMANGTSSLKNPGHSKHVDLGRGADAADVVDASVLWGPKPPPKGQQLSTQDLVKKQKADAYFQAQKQAFDETKRRWGAKADRFIWGGYWHKLRDLAHIENSERVVPNNTH